MRITWHGPRFSVRRARRRVMFVVSERRERGKIVGMRLSRCDDCGTFNVRLVSVPEGKICSECYYWEYERREAGSNDG